MDARLPDALTTDHLSSGGMWARSGAHAILAALLPVAVTRLAAFPWAENLYGDAVVRTQLARIWLASPHWMSSFEDGARQFGPLHLYAVGAAIWLWPSPEHAGRVVSLLFGVASVLPLFFLTRRLFGVTSAFWACFAFAFWGLHIQMSTTAGSEALSVFLLLTSVAFYARGRDEGGVWLALAAVGLNLAAATRYDAWIWGPILAAGLVLRAGAGGRDRRTAWLRAAVFGLASLVFPLLWLWGNARSSGDPFAPFRFIDGFHQGWAQENVVRWGAWGARSMGLFFWPATALLTLSPLVGAFGMVGLVRSYRARPDLRWLFWLVVIPTASFAVRGALLSFVPLARFTVAQLVLLLPFVGHGFEWALARARPGTRRAVIGIAALLTVGFPAALAALTFRSEAPLASALRPVSPISRNPQSVMAAARALGVRFAREPGVILLDEDPAYWDLQIAFFSGLKWDRFIRRRWADHLERRRRNTPDYVLITPGGPLLRDPDVRVVDGGIEVAGLRYVDEPDALQPFRLFRRTGEPMTGQR